MVDLDPEYSPITMVPNQAIQFAIETAKIEANGIHVLIAALSEPELAAAFEQAVSALIAFRGRLIVTGMGKSGIIGRKIAATMSSTGTPSLYIHPAEASHGDLGMITSDDIVLALSWSGETSELGDIILYCRRVGVKLIVMTAHPYSTAGHAADICLALPRATEACPNQLAPTTSTTIQLVLGDGLAVALLRTRGFSASDFRRFHPGGKLGAQLLSVGDVMGSGDQLPVVRHDASLTDATIEMSRKRYGSTAVIDEQGMLVGAFTDGDLRRSITNGSLQDDVAMHMTPNPLTVAPTIMASEALKIMNENAVSMLLVCKESRLVGAVHVHDLLRAGVV